MASTVDPGTDESRAGVPQLVVMGRVSGLYGIKGWVRIYSHTSPREGILGYSPWYLKRDGIWTTYEVVTGRTQGKGVVAKLSGIGDRDEAAALLDAEIAVTRSQLGKPEPGEYFWSDLEGLEVLTLDGQVLGRVSHLFETGANDVMVVTNERERLIPFVEPQVVREVDLEARRIVVDWDPEF